MPRFHMPPWQLKAKLMNKDWLLWQLRDEDLSVEELEEYALDLDLTDVLLKQEEESGESIFHVICEMGDSEFLEVCLKNIKLKNLKSKKGIIRYDLDGYSPMDNAIRSGNQFFCSNMTLWIKQNSLPLFSTMTRDLLIFKLRSETLRNFWIQFFVDHLKGKWTRQTHILFPYEFRTETFEFLKALNRHQKDFGLKLPNELIDNILFCLCEKHLDFILIEMKKQNEPKQHNVM